MSGRIPSLTPPYSALQKGMTAAPEADSRTEMRNQDVNQGGLLGSTLAGRGARMQDQAEGNVSCNAAPKWSPWDQWKLLEPGGLSELS